MSSTTIPSHNIRPQLDPQWVIDHLVDRTQFNPVPHPDKHPDAWATIAKTTGKPYIHWAEKHMEDDWPQIKASQLLAYGRHANRIAMETPYFARRMSLQQFVIAECLTGQGKYMDQIIDGIWAICEEAYWCFPPHMGASRENLLPDLEDPILDLFAAQTGQLMAWTVWLLGDKLDAVSSQIVQQIYRKTRFFVLDAILNHPRRWLGLDPDGVMNNWTPWICSTWLSAVWIFEDDMAKRDQALAMICKALNIYMTQQPDDGGCDEGVAYWTQAGLSLFDCLDQLGKMTGHEKALFMDYPLLHNLARYPHIMHVADNDYVCFADGRAYISTMPGYQISRWALALEDEELLSFGDQLTRKQLAPYKQNHHCDFYRQLQRPFVQAQTLARRTLPLVNRLDDCLPDIQVMTARSVKESGKGWHVSAKGGHNAESHNHNDVGQYVIYRNGHPLLIDLGVETYTGKTFSTQRYEIFTMQSQWHNLPSFGDATQLSGREFAAKAFDHQVVDGVTTFSLDIADAYDPKAQLQSYTRKVILDRNTDQVHIADRFECRQAMPMTLSLITVSDVQLEEECLIFTPVDLLHDRQSAAAKITWKGVMFDDIQIQTKTITDPKLQNSWGDRVQRILLSINPVQQAQWQLTVQST